MLYQPFESSGLVTEHADANRSCPSNHIIDHETSKDTKPKLTVPVTVSVETNAVVFCFAVAL